MIDLNVMDPSVFRIAPFSARDSRTSLTHVKSLSRQRAEAVRTAAMTICARRTARFPAALRGARSGVDVHQCSATGLGDNWAGFDPHVSIRDKPIHRVAAAIHGHWR